MPEVSDPISFSIGIPILEGGEMKRVLVVALSVFALCVGQVGLGAQSNAGAKSMSAKGIVKSV